MTHVNTSTRVFEGESDRSPTSKGLLLSSTVKGSFQMYQNYLQGP